MVVPIGTTSSWSDICDKNPAGEGAGLGGRDGAGGTDRESPIPRRPQPNWVSKRRERKFIETTQPFTCYGSENKRTWSPRLRVRESGNSCLSVHYAEKTKQRLKEPSLADVNCKQSKKARCQWRTPPWPSWNWLFINKLRLRVISRNGPTFCVNEHLFTEPYPMCLLYLEELLDVFFAISWNSYM